jgi:hypothetical protein
MNRVVGLGTNLQRDASFESTASGKPASVARLES